MYMMWDNLTIIIFVIWRDRQNISASCIFVFPTLLSCTYHYKRDNSLWFFKPWPVPLRNIFQLPSYIILKLVIFLKYVSHLAKTHMAMPFFIQFPVWQYDCALVCYLLTADLSRSAKLLVIVVTSLLVRWSGSLLVWLLSYMLLYLYFQNADYMSGQISDLSEKLELAENQVNRSRFLVDTGGVDRKSEDKLSKACKDGWVNYQ